MPVRSLASSVFRWPNKQSVDRAVRAWAHDAVAGRRDIVRVGYFGSYARGDWGVGSDLDLVVVITHSSKPPNRRALEWNLSDLPVSADLIVYTEQEWNQLQQAGARFARTLAEETVWVYP